MRKAPGTLSTAGCKQWTYTGSRHGKLVSMPYWTVPDGALDDADDMKPWAEKAYEAAKRAGSRAMPSPLPVSGEKETLRP